ncbi:MAG: lipopolysaccharide biosynthesis protein [Rhizobiales bacterium]|nr:lipopolysaccharide biosynthesis protein [Hyphomicrobiales bacterium]
MRLAFWRDWTNKLPFQFSSPAPQPAVSQRVIADSQTSELGDVDLRVIWRKLVRNRGWVIVPTVTALVLSLMIVNMITPRYKSEARILIDGRENVFLRPNGERNDDRTAVDAEAVTSQVQLLLSRDLAREVIKQNKLAELPEFDSVLKGIPIWKALLALAGIGRDPFQMTPEERVMDAYFDRLTAYSVDKSRVVVIEFQSRDPELAARVANSIADGYLILQQAARQNQTKSASQWLLVEIEGLRKKVADADARVEEFRSKSGLLVGTNNTTLSNQQLGELNTQVSNARAAKADADAKARAIKQMLDSGKPIEASEVLNSELIRRLSEQRVTLRAQLAEQSSTLLDRHPRILELKAQIADIDRQIREEASKVSRALENDARIAGTRADSLNASLDQVKRQAASTNGQDVQLRAFEREAKAQRDLLESYLAKYREATTRENIEAAPADGRIISRATVSNTPAYPKKLPIVLIATLAMFLLTSGYITTTELLRMTAPRGATVRAPVPPIRDTHPQMTTSVTEIEQLSAQLRNLGEAGRKITIVGAHRDESVALTALTLARLLARNAKVVVADLTMNSPTMAAVSSDPSAPGLTDLMQGTASFGQIITKDRLSGVHMVGAGRDPSQRGLLQLPRINMAIDALLRAYDHVVLDAGTASDLPSSLIASQAHAVVIPDPKITMQGRATMRDQLLASGFLGVTILMSPVSNASAAPGVRAA